jgi:hypothetical protein
VSDDITRQNAVPIVREAKNSYYVGTWYINEPRSPRIQTAFHHGKAGDRGILTTTRRGDPELPLLPNYNSIMHI